MSSYYKNRLQEIKSKVEAIEQAQNEDNTNHEEALRKLVTDDADSFLHSLVDFFEKKTISSYSFRYKIKEECPFGIFGRSFSPAHISLLDDVNCLTCAYKELFDKWWFRHSEILIEVLTEVFHENSVNFTIKPVDTEYPADPYAKPRFIAEFHIE